ncbi:MAG: TIGR02757 family protein [Desulfobacteraceae bacterium]|nr:TIGR02757 family protein [Desulfobacteraceae bacterium]
MISRERLEELYSLYHRRELVHPDPLEFLYEYRELRDREVVGLVASSLAYGRVAQILKSVSAVLERMDPSPFAFLLNSSLDSLISAFTGFKHRFTTGQELAALLWGAKCLIERYGSLHACFTACFNDNDDTILPALSAFVGKFNTCSSTNGKFSLLPSPDRGSACKRLNLFLRWMVRRDEVDPGGWTSIPLSKLIVPLDTHMHRICLLLNLTVRRQADLRTAVDITSAFRRMVPEDPVRYDFALTRLGIRKDMDLASFLKACSMK